MNFLRGFEIARGGLLAMTSIANATNLRYLGKDSLGFLGFFLESEYVSGLAGVASHRLNKKVLPITQTLISQYLFSLAQPLQFFVS